MSTKKFKITKIEIYKVTSPFKKDTIVTDMLRYDRCYACDKFPFLVAYLNGKRPTVGRWESFLQKIEEVDKATFIDPEVWYTFVNRRGDLEKELLKDRKEFNVPTMIEFKTKPCLGVYK
jgi:CRISPR/Cas system CMR-associated protein Cmr5 small subunit